MKWPQFVIEKQAAQKTIYTKLNAYLELPHLILGISSTLSC